MKVVLVDDTKTLLSLIQVYLMGWGLEFFEAGDGEAGLRKIREVRPQLVISDVRMPKMDGFELCAAIRADPALHAIPVVLLTALDDEHSRERGRLVRATEFITKPVTVDALRRTVSKCLGLPPRK